MASAGTIFIDLNLDDKKFKVALNANGGKAKQFAKETESEFDKMSRAVSSKMTNMAAGIAAAFSLRALKNELKSMATAFMEQEKILKQQEAVIRSTAGAAGFTAGELRKMAEGLSSVTTYGSDTIQTVQNLLLTFTNIKGDLFQDATESALNMSTALGQDLKSSAIQLGKALQDPIAGAKALRRVGVALTEDQQNRIKYLMEHNNLLAAQKIILKELATEFGGSARAQTDTFAGKIMQAENVWKSFKKAVGEGVVKFFDATIDFEIFNKAITDLKKTIKDFTSSGTIQEWGNDTIDTLGFVANIGQVVGKVFLSIGKTTAYLAASSAEMYTAGKALLRGDFAGFGEANNRMDQLDALWEGDIFDIWTNWEDWSKKGDEYKKQMAANSAKSDAERNKRKNGKGGLGVVDEEGDLAGFQTDKQKKLADLMLDVRGEAKKNISGMSDFDRKLVEIDLKYDDILLKARDLGATNKEIAEINMVWNLVRQTQEMERQDKLREKAIADNRKLSEITADYAQKLIDAGLSGSKLNEALDRIDKFMNPEERRIAGDDETKKAEAGGWFEKSTGAIESLTSLLTERGIAGGKGGIASVFGAIGKLKGGIAPNKNAPVITGSGSSGFFEGILSGLGGKGAGTGSSTAGGEGAGVGGVAMAGLSAYQNAKSAGMSKGMGAATGAASGAVAGAMAGSLVPVIGTAVGAVVGGVVGGVGGFMGGGGKKKPPSPEEQEAKRLKKEFRAMQYEGWMTGSEGVFSKRQIKANLELYKVSLERIKQLTKEIGDTISGAIKEALKSRTTESAVEDFNKSFSQSFANVFIGMATQSIERIGKQITTPFVQIANDLASGIEAAFYKATKDLRKDLSDAYGNFAKGIGDAMDRVFDRLEKGLEWLTKKSKLLGTAATGVIYLNLMGSISVLESLLSEITMGLGMLVERVLMPYVKVVYSAVRRIEKALDVEPSWIRESRRAGLEIDNSWGSEAVAQFESLWKSLSSIISDAIRAGFNSGTSETGFENFVRTMKEGIYKAMIEGVIKALAAGAIILPAIAPFIRDYVKLISKAIRGKGMDPSEFNRIFTGIADGLDQALSGSEGLFKTWYDIIDRYRDKTTGASNDTSTAPDDQAVAVAIGWESVKARFERLWEAFGVFVDGVMGWVGQAFDRISFHFVSFLDRIFGWIERVFGIDLKPLGSNLPKWVEKIMDVVQRIWNAIGIVWDFLTAPFDWLIAKIKSWVIGWETSVGRDFSGNGVIGSYASGTDYVPKTGIYQLHQGEAVLTAEENRARGGVTVQIGQIVIREEMDIRRAARELGAEIERELKIGAWA